MSWQRAPDEPMAARQWVEAVTHALMEITDKMGALQHHSPRIHEAFRRLALEENWMQDTGGES